MTIAVWLSLIIFLPALAATGVLCVPAENPRLARYITVITAAIVCLLCFALPVVGIGGQTGFAAGEANVQAVVVHDWIPSFGVYYFLALDGLNFPLVLMTALLALLAAVASRSIQENVPAYCALYLLLMTGMLGVFLTLDFFLFYVFFELVLLPMYFLIGVWGGPRKEYAAIKFFLYTLLGSVLILVALLMIYFASDLTQLDAAALAAAHVPQSVIDTLPAAKAAGQPVHTFNLLALQELALSTDVFRQSTWLFGYTLEWWAFVLLVIGFLIKVPSVPLHTWLPDAHVEAPTPISMILAGVLLKIGGYGLIRIAYPICPMAGQELAYVVGLVGVISILYGAFAALAQTDFKRLVAYSSVSHMGYVVLGIAVWSARAETSFDVQSWAMGLNGAMYQMVAHGITSAAMFFLVGVIYDRVHHRDLNRMGGLAAKMPRFAAATAVIFFAALGLPTLCGFIGEIFVLLSVWKRDGILAILAASATIFTAGYILWTIQRVLLGAKTGVEDESVLTDMTPTETATVLPLVVLSIVLGIFPQLVFQYMEPSVTQTARRLATYAAEHRAAANRMQNVSGVEPLPSEKVSIERAISDRSDRTLDGSSIAARRVATSPSVAAPITAGGAAP